jgi:penicillin-binding protein 2
VYNLPGFREKKGEKSVIISREDALKKMAKGSDAVEIDSLRQYPYKEALAHILGYIGQVSDEDLRKKSASGYQPTDWVGKEGIEKMYEEQLRGVNGKELVEVDAMGGEVRKLGKTDPLSGRDITLTIDAKLQEAVYKAMSGVTRGAVVVSTPTGEILAMVSKPSFDPNLFTMGSTYRPTDGYQSLDALFTDSVGQPLLNRVISGTYPPGSTFKLVTAAAGLENNLIDAEYTVADTGVIRVGAFSFANWFFTQYGRTDGDVNVVKAISRSNDIFFYKLAELVKVDRLAAMAKEFGVGRRSGIDLEGEATGVLPTQNWKKEVIGESWYLGDTYHYGIGQGYLLTTPLQVNNWTEAIANGGSLYAPRLLKDLKSEIRNTHFLNEKNISLIRQGMIASCSSGGVAWPLFDFKVKNQKLKIDGKDIMEAPQATTSADFKDYRKVVVACKTGTAQHGGEETKPHAWITLFAPAYTPQIVVTVLSEESGEGSSVAGPIAKKILEAWFSK